MSIPGSASPLFFQTAAGAAAFTLEKSVRFNSEDNASLSKTLSSDGNIKKWTWAGWVKRGKLGSNAEFFGVNTGTSAQHLINFDGSDRIHFYRYASGYHFRRQTTQKFRDPSAWYHIVAVYDTDNATAADRAILYVNGSRVTDFGTSVDPTSGETGYINDATYTQNLGSAGDNSREFDGYLADVYFIDGSALDPTSFGAFDANGVWQAAAYSGTFGTNGFHLFDFANESGIGNDSSGNDNDWTVNNLTASLPSIASPNRPTWNGSVGSNWTRSNSNYDADYSGSGYTAITAALSANTTYHFYLNFKDGGGAYGGWFFSSTSTAPSNTVPDELGSNSLGLRTGESSLGTYGTYATANGTSNTQDQINVSALNSQSSGEYNIEFVINTTAGKVWAKKPSDSGYVGGGDPTDSTSTASFLIPTGAQYFGYMGHSTNTFANFKTTAGNPVDVDVLRDVPTNGNSSDDTGSGGEVSGNFATWNPLFGENVSLSNGNLKAESSTSGAYAIIASTMAMTSGKWYMEYHYTKNAGEFITFGISQTNRDGTEGSGVSDTAEDFGFKCWSNGFKAQTNGANQYSYSSTVSDGDILSLAFDADAGKLWVAQNGTWMTNAGGTGDPANGNNPDFSSLDYAGGYFFMAGPYGSTSSTLEANFGARPWTYAAPSGFKALNTASLPTPTIANGRDHFDAKIYTGNGSSQSITGYNFSPNFVWLKSRSASTLHTLQDTVRGANKALEIDGNQPTPGEITITDSITSFNSDGFSLGSRSTVNDSSKTYVAWAWNIPGSASSNSDGTIASSVTKNADAGVSIVTWTGTGAAGTVGHGLGSKPDLIVVKVYGDSSYNDNWPVYSSAFDGTKYAYLNDTRKFTTYAGFWNDGTATSTVFPVGDDNSDNTKSLIAYCFTSIDQYSRAGVYTGNGSNDGPFIHTNFRPKFILSKRTDSTSDWSIVDSERDGYNFSNKNLYANDTYPESTGTVVDILSNGFKWRTTLADFNASGGSFIYLAFAENPFQANGGLAR